MAPRFASIPKCASRSLKALGLLGELEGRCHTKITEYPDWEKYEWFAVDRPEAEWLESWWMECRDSRSMFGQWLGFEYLDFGLDMEKLNNPPATPAPCRWGVNQWVRPDFTVDFLSSGLSFKDYCFREVTCGLPVVIVMLADLDDWLIAHGCPPTHENVRENVSR